MLSLLSSIDNSKSDIKRMIHQKGYQEIFIFLRMKTFLTPQFFQINKQSSKDGNSFQDYHRLNTSEDYRDLPIIIIKISFPKAIHLEGRKYSVMGTSTN